MDDITSIDGYDCVRVYETPTNYYRDLSKPVKNLPDDIVRLLPEACPDFPGYKYEYGVSTYRGEEVGEIWYGKP